MLCGTVRQLMPRLHRTRKLIVQTLVFSLSYLHRQLSPPETLVVEKWPVISTHTLFGFFYMPQICDMGQTALVPFRRNSC